VAKVREDAPFDKICYIGCGVTTGVGAVINTAKVEIGAKAVVFGLGGIGLNVIQGLRLAGADMIIGVDINPATQGLGRALRHDPFRQSEEIEGDIVPYLVEPDEDPVRPDRRGGLHLRLHRQRAPPMRDALEAPSRLGRVDHHRRGAGGGRDRHPAVPAGHRAGLEGHGLRRRARADGRAEDRRLVHGRQDRDRPDDHPHC
jgi:hypothetical protein